MDWAQIFRDNASHSYKYFDMKNIYITPLQTIKSWNLFFVKYLPKE